ncbi:MAG: deoxyguanosinetriphosphate triphosphohydrolase, partial [Oscillospiraceae bacterium]
IIDEGDIPWQVHYTLGRSKSERITTFVNSLIENSTEDIRMSNDVMEAFKIFNEFLFEAVYKNPEAKGEEIKVNRMIHTLYEYFCKNVDKLSGEYKLIAENEGIDRAVCDYISGMTDRYSVSVYNDIFVPLSWGG